MPPFTFPIAFEEMDETCVRGSLELEDSIAYELPAERSGQYRPGRILLDGCTGLDLVLYDSPPIQRFIYLRPAPLDRFLLTTAGLSEEEIPQSGEISLPGQLCFGAKRSQLIGKAMIDLLAGPPLRETISRLRQENLALFPIAREGLKYQVGEAIFVNYGYYADEVILDAHHVFDQSVPVYNRKVEMTLFKDKDLDLAQHEQVRVAFIADSIASGLVMKEVIDRIRERFRFIEQVEVISPLATVRGLCRIAMSQCDPQVKVRVHVFETLLNALPPDYYFSAHFPIPELHMRPELEDAYRRWWGEDTTGNALADTACAGYGWSEVFYSPRKQIEMINGELQARHGLTIAEIIRRNLPV